jgi:hypothetical protein
MPSLTLPSGWACLSCKDFNFKEWCIIMVFVRILLCNRRPSVCFVSLLFCNLHKQMPPKFMCDGCRGMFFIQDMKTHLGFDQEADGGPGKQLNNRGTRRTTAPAFNLNDPSLFLERCPLRAERVGRAGAMQADEIAPQSLPIILPYHLGRAQLEELKDHLIEAWHDYHTRKAKAATQNVMERNAKAYIAPSASSAVRPREGRNVLLADDVKKMNAAAKKANQQQTQSSAPLNDPVKDHLPVGHQRRFADAVPPRPSSSKPLPAYMRPLQRGAAPSSHEQLVRPGSAQMPPKSLVAHVDPQSVTQTHGGAGRGGAGYVRITSGQVVPLYVKL